MLTKKSANLYKVVIAPTKQKGFKLLANKDSFSFTVASYKDAPYVKGYVIGMLAVEPVRVEVVSLGPCSFKIVS